MYISVYNTHLKFELHTLHTAATIKTHFECLRDFLLFLLSLPVLKHL